MDVTSAREVRARGVAGVCSATKATPDWVTDMESIAAQNFEARAGETERAKVEMTSLGDRLTDEEVDELIQETDGDGDVRQCTGEQIIDMPVVAHHQVLMFRR